MIRKSRMNPLARNAGRRPGARFWWKAMHQRTRPLVFSFLKKLCFLRADKNASILRTGYIWNISIQHNRWYSRDFSPWTRDWKVQFLAVRGIGLVGKSTGREIPSPECNRPLIAKAQIPWELCQSEPECQRAVDSNHRILVQSSDHVSESVLADGSDLVHHDPARLFKTV